MNICHCALPTLNNGDNSCCKNCPNNNDTLAEFLFKNQKSCPEEYIEIVNDNFWSLF